MITITDSIDIAAAPETVWNVVADYRRDVSWRRGVVSMEPSSADGLSPGVTTSEVMRFAGRSLHNDGVVTDVAPGHMFRWRTTRGADASGSRRVDALPGGRSRVTLELCARPHGAERLIAPLLGRLLASTLRGDLRRLRDLVESADGTVLGGQPSAQHARR